MEERQNQILQAEEKKSRALFWIILILIILVVGIGVYYWLSGSGGVSGVLQPPALPLG